MNQNPTPKRATRLLGEASTCPPFEPPAAFTVAAHRRANWRKHHPLHLGEECTCPPEATNRLMGMTLVVGPPKAQS